jgi:hypothetical protein
VRPHLEPHGPDGLELLQGFYVDKGGVARRAGQDLLQGAPYQLSASAQSSKEQLLLQVGGPASAPPVLAGCGGGCGCMRARRGLDSCSLGWLA